MHWSRENLAGVKFDRPWKWLLLPGVIILWFSYMFPNSGVASTVASTRHARSPIMTYAYSAIFYLALLFVLGSILAEKG